jgi:hypothetical protein
VLVPASRIVSRTSIMSAVGLRFTRPFSVILAIMVAVVVCSNNYATDSCSADHSGSADGVGAVLLPAPRVVSRTFIMPAVRLRFSRPFSVMVAIMVAVVVCSNDCATDSCSADHSGSADRVGTVLLPASRIVSRTSIMPLVRLRFSRPFSAMGAIMVAFVVCSNNRASDNSSTEYGCSGDRASPEGFRFCGADLKAG